MDVTVTDGDGSKPVPSSLEKDVIENADHIFRNGSIDQLKALSSSGLRYLCDKVGLNFDGVKADELVLGLRDYVSTLILIFLATEASFKSNSEN